MIILLQLAVFLIAISTRYYFMTGRGLRPVKDNPEHLIRVKTNKKRVTGLEIGLRRKHGIPFIMRKERWYHRWLKAIGIATELNLGDAELDKQYFFITDFPHHLDEAVHSGELRRHLQELFALPVKSLHATPSRIWCKISALDIHKPSSEFTRHREILQAISQCTTAPDSIGGTIHRLGKIGIAALICMCLHAGLLWLGLVGVFTPLADSIEMVDREAWLWKAGTYGVMAAVVWLAFIASLFSRSPWICWVLADFVLSGIAGFFLSGVVLTRDINIEYVQAAPTIYFQPVTARECKLRCRQKCGKNCTRSRHYPLDPNSNCGHSQRHHTLALYQKQDAVCRTKAWFEYHLTVQHWNKSETYRFEAKSPIFDSTRIGTIMQLPVNPGALGLEWVDIEKIKPAESRP